MILHPEQLFVENRNTDKVLLGFACASHEDIDRIISFSQLYAIPVALHVSEEYVDYILENPHTSHGIIPHVTVPASKVRALELYAHGVRSFDLYPKSDDGAAYDLWQRGAWLEGEADSDMVSAVHVHPKRITGAFTGNAYIDAEDAWNQITAQRDRYIVMRDTAHTASEFLQYVAAFPVSKLVFGADELQGALVDKLAEISCKSTVQYTH